MYRVHHRLREERVNKSLLVKCYKTQQHGDFIKQQHTSITHFGPSFPYIHLRFVIQR